MQFTSGIVCFNNFLVVQYVESLKQNISFLVNKTFIYQNNIFTYFVTIINDFNTLSFYL